MNHSNHINQGSDIFVNSNTPVVYAIFRDNLGTITHIKTGSNAADEYSFDAFGRRRSATNWSYTLNANDKALFADRGFTGHEHLTQFGLINMNGRLYDPLVGRFLNPDNYVQSPGSTQGYNRYSYCLNNPLRYTDPSGQRLEKWYDWLNPMNYFIEGMQFINDNTVGLRQSMVDAGIPAFNVDVSIGSDGYVTTPGIEAYKTSKGLIAQSAKYDRELNGWRNAAQGQGSKTLDNLNTINNIADVGMDIAEESGYVATIGRTGYYSSGWNGNQYVKTLGVAKGLGYVFFGAGIVLDGTMYYTGQQSGAKTSVNIGVSTASLIIGGIPGIILGGGYFAVDKTVGWDRMMTPASNDQWVPNRAVFPDGTTIYVCFKAGTEILAKGGFKPIEQIVVGDSVYSYNLEKNAIELSKVVKSFERKTQEIYELTTDNQKIYVTAEHPFYVVGSGWVKVKDLQAGAVLKTKDGSIEHVISPVLKKHPETVYNIEVEGNHNYFVTNSNILVHNK